MLATTMLFCRALQAAEDENVLTHARASCGA